MAKTFKPETGGGADFDPGQTPDLGLTVPWIINPAVSYLNFQSWIEEEVDSGIAIHQPLPQNNDQIDNIGAGSVYDANFSSRVDGYKGASSSTATYIQQRMAPSKYRFCLKGWSIRAGYLNEIPKQVTVGGVTAVPDDSMPQKLIGPRLIANNYGIPIYYAAWQFWYTCLVPPKSINTPPPNFPEAISATQAIPKEIQVPISQPDPIATKTRVTQQPNFNFGTPIAR